MGRKTIASSAVLALLIGTQSICIAQSGNGMTKISQSNLYQEKAPDEKMKPGDMLPEADAQLKNAAGKDISLNGAMGKEGLLVMFSCNTCPFVIKNQPITKKVMEYAQAHKIGVVIINSNEAKRGYADSYNEMQKYAKEQGYEVPYLVDENSKLADLFGANHTPEVFLFDKNKKLVYKGAMNDNPSDPASYKRMYVTDAIDAVMAGKEISPQSTKSIGCSIKRKA